MRGLAEVTGSQSCESILRAICSAMVASFLGAIAFAHVCVRAYSDYGMAIFLFYQQSSRDCQI